MAYVSKGLLAGITDEDIQRRITDPVYIPVWKLLVAKWEAAAEADAGSERIAFRYACGSSYMTSGLKEAALAYRLTRDARALAHVNRQFDKLAAVWSDPPASLKEHIGGRTPYFSDAEACMALDLCMWTPGCQPSLI